GETDVAQEALILVDRAKDSLKAGDMGGAAQDFATALQMDANSAEARAGLARISLDSGDALSAQALLDDAPKDQQDHPDIASVRAALSLVGAEDTEATDNTEQAEDTPDNGIADLLARVEGHPDDLDARLNLAKAYAAAGDNKSAVDHLLHSIAANRTHDDEAARKFLLTIFEAEGVESEIAIDGRKRLASILFA
ncbi:MAG TPA: tetratricopeptide repeat protein, partial [Hellea balneolensis]|nr:tetratricopeptide repeat protein [Hellea balneolensis]